MTHVNWGHAITPPTVAERYGDDLSERLIGETIEGRGGPQFLDRLATWVPARQPSDRSGTDPVTRAVRRDRLATHDTERHIPASSVPNTVRTPDSA
ncbi:MAG: hypothetical protein K0A98_01885 [Trueperaceae bacterium]|nr:hypothetical protein [Trueperaceae bacterium]